jgi:hypothetical protein
LSLGKIDDYDGFGIGHMPLARSTFSSWHPELVMKTTVALTSWMDISYGSSLKAECGETRTEFSL